MPQQQIHLGKQQKRLILFFMLISCFIGNTRFLAAEGSELRFLLDRMKEEVSEQPEVILLKADSLLLEETHHNSDEYARLLSLKATALSALGKGDKALSYHFQAYMIFEKRGNQQQMALSLSDIAVVHYNNLGNYKRAEEYLQQALKLISPTDSSIMKSICMRMGVAKDYGGKPEEALQWYRRAIPYIQNSKDAKAMAINYHNMAIAYAMMDEPISSERYELLALEYQRQSESNQVLAMISITLGSLYLDQGRLEESQKYLLQGGQAAEKLNSLRFVAAYYENMANLMKLKGSFSEANLYLEKLLSVRDSINASDKLRYSAELEEGFQNELKRKEIELLKAETSLAESRVRQSRIWWLVFVMISLLSTSLLMVIYRNYKLKQRANLALELEKNELKAQNLQLENDNILAQFETLKNQVSPHFLFNTLGALTSLIRSEPDKAVEFTQEFSKIFRSILELKDKPVISLAEELEHVHTYLYLQKIHFGENFKVCEHIDADSLKLYLPPFALQILIENAVKHNIISKDNILELKISAAGNRLQVSNKLQRRASAEESTGMGLKNIRSRYQYLADESPAFKLEDGKFVAELPLLQCE